jgi:uncharacterized surface protein with fasciclin (FAS1) repeats
MKNIKIFNILTVLVVSYSVVSCTLLGLPLQEEYPYEYTSKDPNIYMTAYQFVEGRQSLDMAKMYQAINLTGLKEEYEKPDRTFLILNDNAFASYITAKKLGDLANSNIDALRNYLLSNIVKGKFTSLDLTTVPMDMDILVKNDTLKLFLNRVPVGPSTANKYQLHINNFPGTARFITVRTSNILPTNGVIHVVNDYPEYRITPIK